MASFELVAPAVPAQASGDPVQVTATPSLFPAWSTAIHFYVTRCNNSPVQLSITAQPGYTVSVDRQKPQTGSFAATVNNISAGQQFIIATGSGPGTGLAYYIRCLPTDFPSFSAQRNGTTQSRFYVAAPSLAAVGTATPPTYVAVFDNNGAPRWWKYLGPGPQAINIESLPNGNLLWSAPGTGVLGGNRPIEEHKLDGTLVRSYPTAETDGGGDEWHDFQFLPNGNYLIMDVRKTVQVDLTQCGGTGTGTELDPVLQEMTPAGVLVWSWDTYAHIPISEVSPAWYHACQVQQDAYHWNAVEYVPATSTSGEAVLLSYRHLDAVYQVDMLSGNISFKIGGTPRVESLTVLNDAEFTANGGFGGQHDVRLYRQSPEQITIHDNGTDRTRAPRAVRYQLDLIHHTATLLEEVKDPSITSSICCGAARKLVNGDWVVSWGGNGQIDELTPSGASIVFSLTIASPVFSYRVTPVTGYAGRYWESTTWQNAMNDGMNTQFPRPPGG